MNKIESRESMKWIDGWSHGWKRKLNDSIIWLVSLFPFPFSPLTLTRFAHTHVYMDLTSEWETAPYNSFHISFPSFPLPPVRTCRQMAQAKRTSRKKKWANRKHEPLMLVLYFFHSSHCMGWVALLCVLLIVIHFIFSSFRFISFGLVLVYFLWFLFSISISLSLVYSCSITYIFLSLSCHSNCI